MAPELGALGAKGLSEAGPGLPDLSPSLPSLPRPAPSRSRAAGSAPSPRFLGSSRTRCLGLTPETSNTNNFQFAWEFQSHNPMLNNRLDASGRETGFKKKK